MLKGNIEKDMKSRRILIIFSKLSNGEKVNKKSLCLLFNVSSKTIQRDIDDMVLVQKCFLCNLRLD